MYTQRYCSAIQSFETSTRHLVAVILPALERHLAEDADEAVLRLAEDADEAVLRGYFESNYFRGTGAGTFFGVRKIFARISPNLPAKILGRFLCKQHFLKRTLWDDPQRKRKKFLHVILQTLGAIFVQILRRFSQILPRFSWILLGLSPDQSFLGVRLHPVPPTPLNYFDSKGSRSALLVPTACCYSYFRLITQHAVHASDHEGRRARCSTT